MDITTLALARKHAEDTEAREQIAALSEEIAEKTQFPAESELSYQHLNIDETPMQKIKCQENGVFAADTKILLGRNYVPDKQYFNRAIHNGITFTSRDNGIIDIVGTTTANASSFLIDEAGKNIKFAYDDLSGGDVVEVTVYSKDLKHVDAGGKWLGLKLYCYGNTTVEKNVWLDKSTISTITVTLPEGFTSFAYGILVNSTGITYDSSIFIVVRKTTDTVLDGVIGSYVDISGYHKNICTYPNPSVLEYMVGTKEYVDMKTGKTELSAESLIYLTPEMYGAKGNGKMDDTASLQACIDDAIAKNKPIRGFGNYIINGAITIKGSSVDMYLHTINANAESAADILTLEYVCDNSHIQFGEFVARTTGAAIALKGARRCKIEGDYLRNYNGDTIAFRESVDSSTYNLITITSIIAQGYCIHGRETDNSDYYNQFVTRELRSIDADCVSNLYECTIHASLLGAEKGWAFRNIGSVKVYDACFEHILSGGINNATSCDFYGLRTVELNDYTSAGTGNEGTFLKLSGEAYGNSFYCKGPVYLMGLDLSEMQTQQEYIEFMGNDDKDKGHRARRNYVFGEILNCNSSYMNKKKTLFPNQPHARECTYGSKAIIVWGRAIVIPDDDAMAVIDVALTDMRTNTYPMLPTRLKISTDASIILGDSYCSLGINKLVVDQTTNKATIYDRDNTLIFDGGNLDNGVYEVRFIANYEQFGKMTCKNLLRDTVKIKKVD